MLQDFFQYIKYRDFFQYITYMDFSQYITYRELINQTPAEFLGQEPRNPKQLHDLGQLWRVPKCVR